MVRPEHWKLKPLWLRHVRTISQPYVPDRAQCSVCACWYRRTQKDVLKCAASWYPCVFLCKVRNQEMLYEVQVCGEICSLRLASSRFNATEKAWLLGGHLCFLSAWILCHFWSTIQTQFARLWQNAACPTSCSFPLKAGNSSVCRLPLLRTRVPACYRRYLVKKR